MLDTGTPGILEYQSIRILECLEKRGKKDSIRFDLDLDKEERNWKGREKKSKQDKENKDSSGDTIKE